MEIYKNIEDNKNKEFEKLLVDNFSKTKIEEGKILTGTITKITEKHVYCLIDGMKSEALIDIAEIKSISHKPINGLTDRLKKLEKKASF